MININPTCRNNTKIHTPTSHSEGANHHNSSIYIQAQITTWDWSNFRNRHNQSFGSGSGKFFLLNPAGTELTMSFTQCDNDISRVETRSNQYHHGEELFVCNFNPTEFVLKLLQTRYGTYKILRIHGERLV